jgi:hypothetical protein
MYLAFIFLLLDEFYPFSVLSFFICPFSFFSSLFTLFLTHFPASSLYLLHGWREGGGYAMFRYK